MSRSKLRNKWIEPCQLSESDIEHLPKLDIDWYLNNGYITAEDYRKQLNHFDG